MHEGRAMTWRDVAEKHHADFIDDMQALYDASIRTAVQEAVEEARREAEQELARFRAEFEARLTEEIEKARTEANGLLHRERETSGQTRRQELEGLRAESEAALAELRASLEQRRDLDVEQPRRAALQSFSEQWNQKLRRLRLCSSSDQVFDAVADMTGAFARQVVVLSFEDGQGTQQVARVASGRTAESSFAPEPITFPVGEAPALLSVIETRDPLVALAVEPEISQPLHRILKPAVGEKAYLFPLRSRQAVVAVLIAHGEVPAAALEFLSELAGFQLEVLQRAPAGEGMKTAWASEEKGRENLVQIGTQNGKRAEMAAHPGASSNERAAPDQEATERKAWDQLDGAEQKLHLQAQRFARVQVAQMRLYHPEAVRRGIAAGNLYQPLKSEIDEARKQFLLRFLSISPTMVDYLHLELLRNLAHDNDRLLGQEYPGPMV